MKSINICPSSQSFPLLKQNRALLNPSFVHIRRLDVIRASSERQDLQSSSNVDFPRRSWSSPAFGRQWNPLLSQPRFMAGADRSTSFTNTLLLVLLQLVSRITHSVSDCVERVAVLLSPVSLLSFIKQKLASRALQKELIMKKKFEEWVLESGEDESIVNKFEEWMLQFGRVYKDANEKQKRYLIFKECLEYIEAFNNGEDQGMTVGLNNLSDVSDDEFRSEVALTLI